MPSINGTLYNNNNIHKVPVKLFTKLNPVTSNQATKTDVFTKKHSQLLTLNLNEQDINISGNHFAHCDEDGWLWRYSALTVIFLGINTSEIWHTVYYVTGQN